MSSTKMTHYGKVTRVNFLPQYNVTGFPHEFHFSPLVSATLDLLFNPGVSHNADGSVRETAYSRFGTSGTIPTNGCPADSSNHSAAVGGLGEIRPDPCLKFLFLF